VQAKKITDDLCSSNSHYYWEGCAKAINPKLTSTLVKARPRGDSLCEWVFELQAWNQQRWFWGIYEMDFPERPDV